MIPILSRVTLPLVRASGAGRFVAHFRSRAIGSESLRAETGPGGSLRIRSTTEIALHRFSLRQSVTAEFAADLRPHGCTVDATVNARRMSLKVEIGRDRAILTCRTGEGTRSQTCAFGIPPLLLIDNCFASHALAALASRLHAPQAPAFFSLPACEELPVTRSPALKVLLGGREYPPPAVSLHLAPDLDEHVWFQDDWVERLVIPQTQMRVEWQTIVQPSGGPS